MRIKVIVPFPLDEHGVELRRAGIPTRLLPDDVQLDFVAVKNGPRTADSIYDVFLMDMFIFEAGLTAQAEGYDAVCIDTVSDSGLRPLRSRLDIPVVGPGQVACHIAAMLGVRFSFLATWSRWEPIYRKLVRDCHVEHLLASVRSPGIKPDMANLITKPEDTFPALLVEAQRAVDEDGAGVIILASTTMWQAHDYLQEHLPVPVINPGVWAVKMAELFVRLGKSHSKADYPPPPEPIDDEIFEALRRA